MNKNNISSNKITVRSRSGCLNCRARKKKCSQSKPVCELCHKRGEKCIWPPFGAENKNKPRNKKIRFLPSVGSSDFDHNCKFNQHLQSNQASQSLICESEVKSTSKELQSGPFLSSAPLDSEMADFNYTDEIISFENTFETSKLEFSNPQYQVACYYYPLYDYLNLPLPINLRNEELAYFDYYCNYIAKEISVVPQKTNYFLNMFLPIAMREKSVLLCLISWGCIFKNFKLNNMSAKKFGAEFIRRSLYELKSQGYDKISQFIPSLTCYTILMCIEITTGDTDAWSRYLTKSYDLINEMGGFGILENFSSEGRILAGNFVYFDILASQSNENGTYYPISEYSNIFNSEKCSDMIDSLQGCIKPLILFLGEVINIVVENKKLCIQDITEELYYERYGTILSRCNELETKVQGIKIIYNQGDLENLMENGEMEIHLQMFEIYQMTISLYIKQAVRKIPPIVPEIQALVFKIKRCLSMLINSTVKPLLCFQLLIAGLNSVTLADRKEIMLAIDQLILTYEFTNIRKIKQVLREVWILNQNGTLCIDWFGVTKNFGWRLNLGR